MQTKIIAFFQPQNPSSSSSITHNQNLPPFNSDTRNTTTTISSNNEIGSHSVVNAPKDCGTIDVQVPSTTTSSKVLNVKRSYAQLHLDLGQSDFLLHTCSTCCVKYACGVEADEKLHKELHRDYTHGIKFKGWKNERVVSMPSSEAGRILLVLDGDPLAHKKMVEKVLQRMEVELGSGSLVHKLCKVYLFIVHQRIAACLVVEPISKAYRVVSKSGTSRSQENAISENNKQEPYLFKFGENNLQRQDAKKSSSHGKFEMDNFMEPMLLGTEAVPAVCGVRAIWVAPAMRRKHLATQLLDAARITFIKDIPLEPSQLAFSEPLSTGSALASRYFGTPSFLAYRADIG